MRRKMELWQLLGFGAVSLLGTLLHFFYDWTGSKGAAFFSAVNESTWEHMKLLFFPMFFFAILQSFVFAKGYENFWCIKRNGILLGLALIPILFYTLRGIFGSTPDWVNIGIFFIAAAIAFLYETGQFRKGSRPCPLEPWAVPLLCCIAAAFFIFTFLPPKIPLFQDPMDGSYGLKK